jgi:hypothetical protein
MRITNVSVVETTCLDQTQNLILVMNGSSFWAPITEERI